MNGRASYKVKIGAMVIGSLSNELSVHIIQFRQVHTCIYYHPVLVRICCSQFLALVNDFCLIF